MSPVMTASTASGELRATYTAVPLVGLVADQGLPFPLYLRTSARSWVLYQPEGTVLDESHIGRLRAEGVANLYIEDGHREVYARRVEAELPSILLDRAAPLERRAEVLHGVASLVAEELLAAQPDAAVVARAQKVMMSTSGLLLRDPRAFAAVRRVLRAGDGLARHSLTVAFLSMGLAQAVLAADGAKMAEVGLAALLHDVGKLAAAAEGSEDDHAERGAEQLRSIGLSTRVCEIVRLHHAVPVPHCSATPEEVAEAAAVVGLVDLFEEVYSAQEPGVGVYDALRVLAQAYDGQFDEGMAAALVRLFR